jgi:hypothetical protein
MSFYSPIDRLMQQSTRPKGTGAEYMTELSKQPGFKQAEVEDRDLQALMALPKMDRAAFMAQLKAKPALTPKERVLRNDINPNDRTYEEEYDAQYHGVTGEPHHEEYTLPGGTNYREILLQHPQGRFPGVDAHFGGAPNVLASIRAKDRTGPKGEKILHIEEIQSDWHKQGSKRGYQPKGVDLNKEADKAKMQHTLLGQKLKEARESSDAIDRNLASDQPIYQNPEVRARQEQARSRHNEAIMDLMPQVMRAEEAHRVAQETARSAVPEAPFKKNWHELALKRMIHHAAEKGYHQIHLTPGETQAERWGTEGKSAKGFHDLYDKQLPQFLNKFGKQYGSQVQPGQVATAQPQYHVHTPEGNHWTGFRDTTHAQEFADKAPGSEVRVVPPPSAPVHTFDITPAMREDVLKNGMPLYSGGGEVLPAAEREANKAKFLADSKIKDRLYHATPKNFTQFVPGGHDSRISGPATWLSANPKHQPAMHNISGGLQSEFREGTNVMPVHVQVKNPMVLDDKNMLAWAQAAYAGGSREFPELMPKEWADEVKKDYDSIILADPHKRGDTHEIIMFNPNKIKSATGNRGTYDVNKPDINKAKGGVVSRETIKPVAHGIIKERVTVSPNLDAMQYELMSAKHFTKKVK